MSTEDFKLETEENPFSERMQKWWVKKFVVLHTANKITVDTSKTVMEERELTLKEESFRRTWYHYEPRRHIILDERFKDLTELERRYRQEVAISKKEWMQVEKELYPLIMLLFREKRITGTFELPPLQDLIEF